MLQNPPTVTAVPGLLLGLIDRPTETFHRLARGARWVWGVPFLLLVVGHLLYIGVSLEPSREFSARIAEYTLTEGSFAAQMSPQQREQALAQAQQPPSPGLLAINVVGGIVATALGWAVWGLALHGLATLLGARESRIGGLIAVVSWAWLPLWLRQMVQSLFVWQSGELPRAEALSLAALVASGDPVRDTFDPLFLFLSAIDPWQLANWWLLVVGVAAVTALGRGKSAGLVLTLWLLFSLLAVTPVLVSKMVTGL